MQSLNNHFNVPRTAIAAGCAALAIFFIANIEELSSIATTGGFLAPAIFGGLAFVAIVACVSKKNIKPKSSFRSYYFHQQSEKELHIHNLDTKPHNAYQELQEIRNFQKKGVSPKDGHLLKINAQVICDKFITKSRSLAPACRIFGGVNFREEQILALNVIIQGHSTLEELRHQWSDGPFQLMLNYLIPSDQSVLADASSSARNVYIETIKALGFDGNDVVLARHYYTNLCTELNNLIRSIPIIAEYHEESASRVLNALGTLSKIRTLDHATLVLLVGASGDCVTNWLVKSLEKTPYAHTCTLDEQRALKELLCRAIRDNQPTKAKAYLLLGAPKDKQHGDEYLSLAADANNVSMGRLLLACEVNYTENPYYKACQLLLSAIVDKHLQKVSFFLDLGVSRGDNLLAFTAGLGNRELVRLVCKRFPEEIEQANQKKRFFILSNLVYNPDQWPAKRLILEELLNQGIDVNCDGVLETALNTGNTAAIEFLFLHAKERIRDAIATGNHEAVDAIFADKRTVIRPTSGTEYCARDKYPEVLALCLALREFYEGHSQVVQ